jgi:hypothetical protein
LGDIRKLKPTNAKRRVKAKEKGIPKISAHLGTKGGVKGVFILGTHCFKGIIKNSLFFPYI